jgi:hypothetical protein
MIKTDKKYDNLVTFGCSFTMGHLLGEEGSWGYSLSKLLGCNHINKGGGGSNTNIFNNVVDFCENNDMSNSCVGIQWSEITRREFWDDKNDKYYTLGMGTFADEHQILKKETNFYDSLSFIKNNQVFFGSMWFNLSECTLRTVIAMISAKAYLKSKNIDFIMFEGINSIKNINTSFYPKNHRTDINSYNPNQFNNFGLISESVRESILNDDTFYSELGDWMNAMYKHPDYDEKLNDGHPHKEIVDWWVNNLYTHIKNVESKNL